MARFKKHGRTISCIILIGASYGIKTHSETPEQLSMSFESVYNYTYTYDADKKILTIESTDVTPVCDATFHPHNNIILAHKITDSPQPTPCMVTIPKKLDLELFHPSIQKNITAVFDEQEKRITITITNALLECVFHQKAQSGKYIGSLANPHYPAHEAPQLIEGKPLKYCFVYVVPYP